MNRKYNVLITDGLDEEGLQVFDSAGCTVTNESLDQDNLELVADKDILIVRSKTKVTEKVIDAGKNLKIIGRSGIGVDNIDIVAASKGGIVVKNAPNGNVVSAAELTLGLVLDLARHITNASQCLRGGTWRKSPYMGMELTGRTWGIYGVGKIGKTVAEFAKGIKMNVIGYDTEPDPNFWVEYVNRDELFKKSDVITIHTPGGKGGPDIAYEDIKNMKKGILLVNTSRGDNVDENAVYEYLKNGHLGGAALDVHSEEPSEGKPFKNRLCEFENFTPTPHLGASTREAQRKSSIEIAHVSMGYVLHGDWENAVNAVRTISDKAPTNNAFITHDDREGLFENIGKVYHDNGISIPDIESRKLGYAGVLLGYANVVVRSPKPITEKLIRGLEHVPGVIRVTY